MRSIEAIPPFFSSAEADLPFDHQGPRPHESLYKITIFVKRLLMVKICVR